MSTQTAAAPPQTKTTTWNIDPAHTVAEFKVRHMMIANVKGHFSKVSGVLIRDESDPANDRVEATIEAASIRPATSSVMDISRARISSTLKSFPPCTSSRPASTSWARENCQWKAT